MIAFLNETILWWHWVVFGLILLIIDTSTGTIIIFWLGLAAVLVGIIDTYISTSFTAELSIWIILSSIIIAIWLKFFKVASTTTSGQSNYRLDTLGTVMEEILPHSRGKVTFDSPVLGNTSWFATTTKIQMPIGTRVKIVQINGQLIEVEPLTT